MAPLARQPGVHAVDDSEHESADRDVARPRGTAGRHRPAPAAAPVWFLMPAFVILVVFFFVPTVFNFVYSFTDWSSFKSDDPSSSGCENFRT